MDAKSTVALAIAEVPKAMAAGVIDLRSGSLLYVHSQIELPEAMMDLLPATVAELFEGDTVSTIEHLFKHQRGITSNEHYFQEILISSPGHWHYFGRLRSSPKTVLALVASANVNLGMFIVKARQITESAA